MIHYLRHGQTDANLQLLNAGGEWDVPLNAMGQLQAQNFAKTQQDLIEGIEAVYVSPMIRTRQTAELVLKGHDKPVEIVEGLREFCMGSWTRLPHDRVPRYLEKRLDAPGGETYDGFESRCVNALKKIAEDSRKILVVGHGAVWYTYAAKIGHEILYIDNCATLEICRMKLCHLRALKSPLNGK